MRQDVHDVLFEDPEIQERFLDFLRTFQNKILDRQRDRMWIVWHNSKAKMADRLVLLAIAETADNYGDCWTPLLTLSKLTKVPKPAIKRSLKRLVKMGAIKKTLSPTPRWHPNLGLGRQEIWSVRYRNNAERESKWKNLSQSR